MSEEQPARHSVAQAGEGARRVREMDWSATPLGPMEQWSEALRTHVAITLEMSFPSLLAWGDELTVIYNDGYASLLRGFPDPMGLPFRASWPVECEILTPIADRALRGEVSTLENFAFTLRRGGKPETAYFDLSIIPVRDGGKVAGFLATGNETTERVKHRAHLVEIFERAPVGLSELRLDGRFVFVNDALCQLLGRTRAEVLTLSIQDVTHPEDLPRSWQTVRRLIESGEPASLDKRYVRPDGSVVFANSALSRIDHEHARPHSVLAVTVDLSARKRAEDAIRVAAERDAFRIQLADAMRPLKDAVEIQTAASRVLGEHLKVNRAMYVECVGDSDEVLVQVDYCVNVPTLIGRHRLRDFGSTLLEGLMEGRTVAIGNAAQDFAITATQRAAFAALGIAAYVAVPIKKEGRLAAFFNVHQSCPRDFSAEEIALVEETAERAWDAVQRAQAEAARRRSESRLKLALDASGMGIWEWNLPEDQIRWSSKMFEIIGVACEDFRPEGAWQRQLVYPEDLEPFSAAAKRAIQDHTELASEYRIVRPSGEVRWVESHGRAEYDTHGEPICMVGTLADVTGRKEWERALADNDRRKDEFLATLAHELRNPLAPLRNGLEILQLPGGVAHAQNIYPMMLRQVNILSRLVDDLLEVSRITRGAIELRKERVDLARVVRAALETSAASIEKAQQNLLVSLPGEPLLVDADPMRLAQVFANLLNNAARYTKGKGEIRVRAWRERGEAVVSVQDTGMGIPQEMLSRVFDMFAQGSRAANGGHKGLGIGLTLVRSLVQMHEGSVEARSEGIGRGAEFIVRLPLARAVPRWRAKEHDGEEAQQVATRVLVVDDNHDAADTIGALLDMLGADVRVAYDGPGALAQLEHFAPRVVLLDLGMPGMDGFEVARRLRQHLQARDAILVALTGWGQEEDRRRTEAAGFQHHLVKPPNIQALKAILAASRPESAAEQSGPEMYH